MKKATRLGAPSVFLATGKIRTVGHANWQNLSRAFFKRRGEPSEKRILGRLVGNVPPGTYEYVYPSVVKLCAR